MGNRAILALTLAGLLCAGGCDRGSSGGGSAVAADPPGGEPPPGPPPPPPAPEPEPVAFVTRAYDPTWDVLLNPERGYYQEIDLVNGRDFRYIRANGFTLGLAPVTLSAYRYGPIADSFLASLSQGFDAVRASGIKVVLRFRYATSSSSEDAPKAWILHHIGQLAPLLQAHGDVIAVMQAGFIGAWGEWHTSTNGLANTADRRDVLMAVLRALPAARMVQVRTPHYKRDIFQRYTPVTAGEAFSGSDYARVGYHNDAFLMGDHDGGTFIGDIQANMNFVAEESRFVPVGGETNRYYNPDRIPGPNAVYELSRFHFSFLSGVYYSGALNIWRSSGHYAVIQRDLGYLFSLVDATWPQAVKPGGVLDLTVRLGNRGYSAMYNPRPVYVVLAGNGAWHAGRVGAADPRWWAPGESTFRTRLRVPASLAPGTYRLALWLPDMAWPIQDRPEYSVRFANAGTWDGTSGYNVLTDGFVADPSAPGSSDPGAQTFAEIP